MTNLRTVAEKASEIGAEAKESMDDLARFAAQKVDEARTNTAGALHSAATSVRASGRRGSDAIDNPTTGAADRLDATGSYVEERDLRGIFSDPRKFGWRHSTGFMLAAVAVGFFAGSAITRTKRRGRWR